MVVEISLEFRNAMTGRIDGSSTRRVVAVPQPEIFVVAGITRARREILGLRVADFVEGVTKDMPVPVDG
jgi:hypothetical protein